MSSKNDKSGARDRSAHRGNLSGGDILGGPDTAEHEDIVSSPEREPHPETDILGGPDMGPEDVLTEPGHPARPASHDVLGGPDTARHEDIVGPPDED